MLKPRFFLIQGNLKLCNAKTNKADRIYKVREYTDYLSKKWEEHYYPGRRISVDETIIPYTGKYPGFTVYIKNKPINKGFLVYDIADPRNGYLLKGEIYAGKEKRNNSGLVQTRTIRLLDKYLDKGHIIFGDNFYTSIELVQYLSTRKTGYCGTLRINRDKANGLDEGMKKGQVRYYKSTAYPTLLLTLWWETILVKSLSNCILPRHVFYKTVRKIPGGRKFKEAPLVFKEYSRNAKGVDLANNLAQTYRNIHRTSKWWHCIFTHYLTVSINNAYNIFKHNNPKYKCETHITRKQFIFQVIRKLLNSNGLPNIRDMDFHLSNNKDLNLNSGKKLKHAIYFIKGYENLKNICCNLCNRATIYCCKDCDNGINKMRLCLPCFELYHKDLFKKIEKMKNYVRKQNFN